MLKKNYLFDFSDVIFGVDDDGFWFECDHPLNFSQFVRFASTLSDAVSIIYKEWSDKNDG